MRYLRYVLLGLVALAALFVGPVPVVHAATFTVDSTGDAADFSTVDGVCDTDDSSDDGPCTLRAAIEQANVSVGTDAIAFNIPSAGPHTITPGSALPTITDPVIIDGYTQPGAEPDTNAPGSGTNAVIKIELDGTNAGFGTNGLRISAGDSTVRGLAINRYGGGNQIVGDGILLETNGGNLIEGNFIGTDITGTVALGNSTAGVRILNVPDNTVGGTESGTRNVIAGNRVGIWIVQALASGNVVQGNFIGTDATGTIDLGNSLDGILVSQGPNNQIGGTAVGAGNVISGNDKSGVQIVNSGASGNQVQGNFIGTDVTGTVAVGNGSSFAAGVFLNGAPNNLVGGAQIGAGNVISGNDLDGVEIQGQTGNQVLGNFIGTAADGASPLGNTEHGVFIFCCSANNHSVGGTASGEGNVIAYNFGDGVRVEASPVANPIRGNSIHSNGSKGIENIDGGNTELAPPVITASGSASGTACANCTVDVYSDDADEGRIYHDSVVADGSGNWSFPGGVTGPNVTATATDASGNTSEFSVPFACTDGDSDGVCDSGDNCPSTANPLQENTDADLGTAIPPATFDGVPIGDADGDACDDDDDDDGYSDSAEAGIGTTAVDNCTNTSSAGPGPNTDAWPSDMNANDAVAINDVTGPFAPHFGAVEGVDPTGTNPGDYNPRMDLNQSGSIAINDITGPFAPDFGKTCT